MNPSGLRGIGSRTPRAASPDQQPAPHSVPQPNAGGPSSRPPSPSGPPGPRPRADRSDSGELGIHLGSRRQAMAPQSAAPVSRTARAELGPKLQASDLRAGDVIFYQRPADKPPPKSLSAYTGIVKGQEMIEKRHPEYFSGGSSKTVHCSVCVQASASGDPQIAEASETRGVGQRSLPPGHYVIYRSKSDESAKETARLMDHWTRGDGVPNYSISKAASSVAKTTVGGRHPDRLSHETMGKIAQSADNDEPGFPWKTTFCSDMTAAAVMGGTRKNDRDVQGMMMAPSRTVPGGLQAQLEQNPQYARVGTLDVPVPGGATGAGPA
jgi:hypothetical protein